MARRARRSHITDPVASQKYWSWPYWRVQNLYFLSNTKLGDDFYLKTKAYWSKFDNGLFSYNDADLTIISERRRPSAAINSRLCARRRCRGRRATSRASTR